MNKSIYETPTMDILLLFENGVETTGIIGASNPGGISETPGESYEGFF